MTPHSVQRVVTVNSSSHAASNNLQPSAGGERSEETLETLPLNVKRNKADKPADICLAETRARSVTELRHERVKHKQDSTASARGAQHATRIHLWTPAVGVIGDGGAAALAVTLK